MPTGTVKWFDERQGFGYLLADEGGPDVFVHESVLEPGAGPWLVEGQPVVYEVEATPKGPRAVAVRPLRSR